MKHTIQRHKDDLKNMLAHLLRELESVRQANEACDRTRRGIIALDAQIVEAELRGLDGFDSEKFGKKRKAVA